MIHIRDATEGEMILAFLRAEWDSKRYRKAIAKALDFVRQSRTLIDAPNLADPTENLARRVMLALYRGYDLGTGLFKGFPVGDMQWRYVQLEAQDFDKMRYINDETWQKLTRGTRLVTDGARNYDPRSPPRWLSHITETVADCRNGKRFQPLIAAEDADGSLILIEGHSRATVYVMAGRVPGAEAFVGRSPSISRWFFYESPA